MSKRVRVVVTQAHIDASTVGIAPCPLERALHDAGYPEATVGYYVWWPARSGPLIRLSTAARAFVVAFDYWGKQPARPATFSLEAPE